MRAFLSGRRVLAPLVAALALAGCNANDDDGSAGLPTGGSAVKTLKTLKVTPSLGRISNARVILRNAANRSGPVLGDLPLVAGSASFNVPAGVRAVVAEVVPEAAGNVRYFDEALGRFVDVVITAANRNTPLLRAAAPVSAGNADLGVTAMTEAALRLAEQSAGGAGANLTPEQIAPARATIQSVFGIPDILLPPALVDEPRDLAGLGTSAAEQYALRLAALAEIAQGQLGAGEANPALRMAQALAADLADGDIDGSGVTGDLPYDVAAFAAQFQAQALALVQDLLASASESGFDPVKLNALINFLQSNPLVLNLNPGGGGGGGGGGDCGQMPTLTFADLVPFGGNYSVDIKQDDAAIPPNVTKVKTTLLKLTTGNAQATVQLDGQTANVLSVCQNGPSKNNVLVNLDKGGAHVDFNLVGAEKLTNGIDFTAPSGVFRYFDTTPAQGGGGGGGGACAGNVTATPNAAKDAVALSWPAVAGATAYRIGRPTAKIGQTDIQLTVFIPSQAATSYNDTNNIVSGGTYTYEITADGAGCKFPQVTVEVGNPVAFIGNFTQRRFGSGSNSMDVAAINGLVVSNGSPGSAKSTDGGLTWTSVPLKVNGLDVAFDRASLATDGARLLGVAPLFFGEVTDGAWVTKAITPSDLQPLPQGVSGAPAVYYRAIEYTGGRWIVAGGYTATGNVGKSFIASSADGDTWNIHTFAGNGNFSRWAISSKGGKWLVFVLTDQNVQDAMISIDGGVTWTSNTPVMNTQLTGGIVSLGGYYFMSDGNSVFRSADGISWSAVNDVRDSKCTGAPQRLTVLNGLMYGFCGDRVVASGDGRAWGLVSGAIGGNMANANGQAITRSGNRFIVTGGLSNNWLISSTD
jgi:hypothetical protein